MGESCFIVWRFVIEHSETFGSSALALQKMGGLGPWPQTWRIALRIEDPFVDICLAEGSSVLLHWWLLPL